MKAVLLEGFGGIEVLKVGELAKPVPGDKQVLVRVVATSINRPDLVQREGKYPPPPGDSEILGLEVAGVISELGPGVTGWGMRRAQSIPAVANLPKERQFVDTMDIISFTEFTIFETMAHDALYTVLAGGGKWDGKDPYTGK